MLCPLQCDDSPTGDACKPNPASAPPTTKSTVSKGAGPFSYTRTLDTLFRHLLYTLADLCFFDIEHEPQHLAWLSHSLPQWKTWHSWCHSGGRHILQAPLHHDIHIWTHRISLIEGYKHFPIPNTILLSYLPFIHDHIIDIFKHIAHHPKLKSD